MDMEMRGEKRFGKTVRRVMTIPNCPPSEPGLLLQLSSQLQSVEHRIDHVVCVCVCVCVWGGGGGGGVVCVCVCVCVCVYMFQGRHFGCHAVH